MSLILPPSCRPRSAQLGTKVVFWFNRKLNRIVMGAPENFPAPRGFEKIVCTSAHEAEIWSQRMRDQDKADQEQSDYERELIEGPMREYARAELRHLMANARNNLNRDFCKFALAKLEEAEQRGKTIRESYLHAEAYEAGH